jgi:hypothetical protein
MCGLLFMAHCSNGESRTVCFHIEWSQVKQGCELVVQQIMSLCMRLADDNEVLTGSCGCSSYQNLCTKL